MVTSPYADSHKYAGKIFPEDVEQEIIDALNDAQIECDEIDNLKFNTFEQIASHVNFEVEFEALIAGRHKTDIEDFFGDDLISLVREEV